MKKVALFLFALAIGNLAFAQSGTLPVRGSRTSSILNYRTHPFREYEGRAYDFSEAITWMSTRPPTSCPYPSNNPMARDWAARVQKFKGDGRRWSPSLVGAKFLENGTFEVGTLEEERPEGWIISMPVTTSHDEVIGSSRVGNYIKPVYRNVTDHTTRQILLKNAPGRPTLPVFGFAAGHSSLASGASLETFDYGKPLDSLPQAISPTATVTATTNTVSTSKQSASDANLLKYYQGLSDKGDAYGQFRMGERYLAGSGVPKDEAKAKDLFTKSAAQGNKDAEAALLRMRNAESK